jgi:hypothetical protein
MAGCEVAALRFLPPVPPLTPHSRPRHVEAARVGRPVAAALARMLGPASSLSASRLKPPRRHGLGTDFQDLHLSVGRDINFVMSYIKGLAESCTPAQNLNIFSNEEFGPLFRSKTCDGNEKIVEIYPANFSC